MKTRFLISALLLAAMGAVPVLRAVPAKSNSNVKSDLATVEDRQVVVALANKIARPVEITPVPDEPKTPFAPVGFDRPDPVERRGLPPPGANAGGPPKPSSSRNILETIAARVQSTNSVTFNGTTFVFVKMPGGGQKRLKVGDKLTITFEGLDYELEITAIESTTYTLRLGNEKITRPIKSPQPGKTK
jgi:hypothetical protein